MKAICPFPSYADVPFKLTRLDAPCGPVAAWAVLRHFRRRASCDQILRDCGYHGWDSVFAIGIANALARAGLCVSFHTDPDPKTHPHERRMYRLARQVGITPKPALTLHELQTATADGAVPIVLYDTPSGSGHFSPMLGVHKGLVLLPFHDTPDAMSVAKFRRVWTAPGVCRQVVVAQRLRKWSHAS